MGRRQLWMHLPEIDFARVEQHMQEPDEQPETEDEIEEEMDEENEGEIDSEVSEAQGQAAGETPPAPVVSGSDDSALRLQTLTGRIEDLRTRFAEMSAQYSSFASDFANGVVPNIEGEPDPYELQDEFGEVADAIETLLTVLKLPGFSEPPASLSVFLTRRCRISSANLASARTRASRWMQLAESWISSLLFGVRMGASSRPGDVSARCHRPAVEDPATQRAGVACGDFERTEPLRGDRKYSAKRDDSARCKSPNIRSDCQKFRGEPGICHRFRSAGSH